MNHLKELKRLKNKLWKIIREFILLRDNYTCQTCGAKPKILQVGHFVHKSQSSAVYYEEENLSAQCYRCNIWLRGNVAVYARNIIKRWGIKVFNRLTEAAYKRLSHQWSIEEIQALIGQYSVKLAALKATPRQKVLQSSK